MKRLSFAVALAALTALGSASSVALAEESREAATEANVAREVATEANASFVETEPSFFEASADPTCEDYGFFAADKKTECDKACKKGNKCQRKQVCGDVQCPPPGYCWKCPN
jgi:hypothetical protein